MAVLAPSEAATIVWGAAQDNGFSMMDGSNLKANNLVRIGTFDFANPDDITANQLNIAFLNSHFTELAAGRIGDGLGGADEHFSHTDNANTGASGLNVAGARIYMWVFASSDNSSATASRNSAFQHGIFTITSNDNWLVPGQDPVPGATSIDISDLTNTAGNALNSGSKLLVGSFPAGTSDLSPGTPNFGLAAVPEPSIAITALFGGAALLLRRRRTL